MASAAGKLARAELERYLWSAADILRGSIDSSDYKSYIFGHVNLSGRDILGLPLLAAARTACRGENAATDLIADGFRPPACHLGVVGSLRLRRLTHPVVL